ncbi:FAD-dependent oxidoreductase [Catalinimonas alkaloidigena]|nr:FAD/NAD(P)-binding oxidoreductase [Catalinimonas alkaloidigena]
MQVPDATGIYVIGAFEKRVTLYSQQVRALNLIWALHSLNRLAGVGGDPPKICVIGAGPAGMTAALAAASVGCSVELLEENDTIIPTLYGNKTRWIHPHIYEWPEPIAYESQAKLPILNWKENWAGEVREMLVREFGGHRFRNSVGIRLNVNNIEVDRAQRNGSRRVRWNSYGKAGSTGSFAAVLLAVGFRQERNVGALPKLSYWDNDSLNQPRIKGKVLISGTGDGGLVDLVRVCISDFSHDQLLQFVNPDWAPDAGHTEDIKTEFEQLCLSLQAIEKKAAALTAGEASDASEFISSEYNKLVAPTLDARIKTRLRSSVHVTLNGTSFDPLHLNSSILNRLFASRLISGLEAVTYKSGEIKSADFNGRSYKVTIGQNPPEEFDHVVIRHGVEREPPKFLGWIWDKCAPMRARNALDQTREPAWGNYFGPDAPLEAVLKLHDVSSVEGSEKAIFGSFFNTLGGPLVFVCPRFAAPGPTARPIVDTNTDSTSSDSVVDEQLINAIPAVEFEWGEGRPVTVEGDSAAMESVHDIFLKHGEKPPKKRAVDELTSDLAGRTFISIGLFSNAYTLKAVRETLASKAELVQHIVERWYAIRVPNPQDIQKTALYTTEPSGIDYAMIARIHYEGRTVVVVGGMTAEGTRRVGKHFAENWREIAEQSRKIENFFQIYRVPLDFGPLDVVATSMIEMSELGS